ncbi:CheY-like chemotaxis protein [Rhodoligotrophos appendicifer]|uniref:response regulator n=1 Tax=Rhodoligotrophos appendicifer TaxID=987056 RepID=UPI0011870270|nr:response regulator [Rhodoligotrophos appendicifer]
MMNAETVDEDSRRTPIPTVMVVEDEVLIRVIIAEYLRDCGFLVVEASNGDQALSLLAHADKEFDIVFTDVHMPGSTNGLQLAQWIERERPEIEVILTSGLARKADAAKDLCGHRQLVEKPYDLSDVEQRIRRLLKR